MKTFTRSLPLLLLSGLVVPSCASAPPDDIENAQAAIVDPFGNVVDSHDFGVGLLTDGSARCTATLLRNDLAVVGRNCIKSAMTAVAVSPTEKQKIRAERTLFSQQPELAFFNLRGGLPLSSSSGLSTKDWEVTFDRALPNAHDHLQCIGVSGSTLPTVGMSTFEVLDITGGTDPAKARFVLGPVSNLGNVATANREDIGGYCIRDGGAIALIIIDAQSSSGNLTGVSPLAWQSELANVDRADALAQRFNAISLVDTAGMTALDTSRVTPTMTARSGSTAQAFYVDEISPPPAGGTNWMRLVSARDGRCLVVTTGSVSLGSCGASGATLFRDDIAIGSRIWARIHSPAAGCVDASPAARAASCTTAATQLFQYWANPF